MVVTHSVHKNRRKIKRRARIPDETNVHDSDEEMHGPSLAAQDDQLMIDQQVPDPTVPVFPPLTPSAVHTSLKSETRQIPIPPHRMTPIKKDWVNIFGPLTEILGLQVRMNVQRRCVEIRASHAFHFLQADLPVRRQNKQKILAPCRKVQILSRHMHWALT